MSRLPNPSFESQVRQAARALPYPPTPDLAGAWARRSTAGSRPVLRLRPVWALIGLLALLAGLLAVPPVRAAIREFLQIGAVRIWLVEPTPAPTATRPQPTPTSMVSVLQLSGATTLAEAQAEAPFPIRLPTWPADLGAPDHVFLQNLDGTAVILVWMDEQQPDQVRLSLHLLSSDVIAWKMGPQRVAETTVDGQPAVWAEGPYVISLRNGSWETRQLVSGHVLIWQADSVTYRLESDLTLDEAVRVAESLAQP
jgi:hypothetical protein